MIKIIFILLAVTLIFAEEGYSNNSADEGESSTPSIRTQASIMRVVRANQASLKYVYNRFLLDHPEAKGRLTIKFRIDEFGGVVSTKVIQSELESTEFENICMSKIQSWKFERVNNPGDMQDVVYPFVFTPE